MDALGRCDGGTRRYASLHRARPRGRRHGCARDVRGREVRRRDRAAPRRRTRRRGDRLLGRRDARGTWAGHPRVPRAHRSGLRRPRAPPGDDPRGAEQRAQPGDPRAPRVHGGRRDARGREVGARSPRPGRLRAPGPGVVCPRERVRRGDLRPVRDARLRVPTLGLGRVARHHRGRVRGGTGRVPTRLGGDGDRPTDRTRRRYRGEPANRRRSRGRLAERRAGGRGARGARRALSQVVRPSDRSGGGPSRVARTPPSRPP